MGSDGHTALFIVDNDVAVLDSLRFALHLQGFEVHLHRDGAALLQKRDWPAAGCMILEHSLPESPGLRLMQSLRERGVTLPTIIITGNLTPELEQSAAAAGARQILVKPLVHDLLVEAIRKALQG